MIRFHTRTWLFIFATMTLGAAEKSSPSASLLGGKLTYAPPPEENWERAEQPSGETVAAFRTKDHEAAMVMQALPQDAQMTPQMGPALVRQLRENHRKADQKLLIGPKIEPDKRFGLRIHERYQNGEKISDELHLYRDLGPRIVMVTANAIVKDDTDPKAVQKDAEEVLLSAKWVKKK